MKQGLIFLTLIFVCVMSVGGFVSAQDNLLQNAGFEDDRTTGVAVDPDATSISFNAPVYWGGNVPPPSTQGADYPVGFPHRTVKYTGNFGFQMGRGGALYQAALFQRVENVLSGLEVEGTAHVYIEGDGTRARVGINPQGIMNPFDPGTVWADWEDDSNEWRELRVRATASGTAVTLFLYAEAGRPDNPNYAYWDDATLRVVGGTPIDPPPAPPADPNAPAAAPGVPGAPQQPAQPAGPQPGDLINVVVPYGNLNVRTGAGTSFPIIGLISAPDGYPLIATVGNWHQINYNGQAGYVFAPLSEVQQRVYQVGAPAAPAAPGSTTTTTTNPAQPQAPTVEPLPPTTGVIFHARPGLVAVFEGPDESYPRVGEMAVGAWAHVTGRNAAGWLRIIYNDQTAWVMGRFGLIQGDLGAVPLAQ